MASKNTKRAVGYCRTSGEAQRDNTSIPSQQEAIEAWAERNGYTLIRHYTDEAKSGAKVAGRDGFQKLMRDAAGGKFDVAVVYQISRWGRDGTDIMESARTLGRDFGVDVIDTAGHFDTRDRTNPLARHIFAGLADQERLMILQRTIRGRIARAKAGLPWSGKPPVGRSYDKATGKWYVNEQGRQLAIILKRYAAGEAVVDLAREFPIPSFKGQLSGWIANGQLSGTYKVRFHSPDIGLDETVEVPAIPEIVTPAVWAKVRARADHNRTFNRTDATPKYLLSGFLYCSTCKKALTGQTDSGYTYYRHSRGAGCEKGGKADWSRVRAERLTETVLDYLYRFYLDEPAFNRAVTAALPSSEDRDAITKERDQAAKRLAKVQAKLSRLVNAVADGADSSILIREQDSIKADLSRYGGEVEKLTEQLATMPSAKEVGEAAALLRLHLVQQHKGKDWRKLPHESVQGFLHHLFGDNPKRTGTGIFIRKDSKGTIHVAFKGQVAIPHQVAIVDGHGRVVSPAEAKEAQRLSRKLRETAGKPVRDNLLMDVSGVGDEQQQVALVRVTAPADSVVPAAIFRNRPRTLHGRRIRRTLRDP